MKMFICALIVLTSGFFGITYANKYHKKLQFFEDLAYVFDNFALKIAFFKDNFAAVIDGCQTQLKCKTNFFNLLSAVAKNGTLTEGKIIDCFDLDLTNDEKKDVARYLLSVTKIYDNSTLQEVINNGKNYIQAKLDYYNKKDKVDGSLIKKLSISIGLVVSILIY